MSVLVNMPGRGVLSKLRVDYDLGPRLPQIDASERADIDRLIHLALAQQARARDTLGASGGCNFNSPTIKGALRLSSDAWTRKRPTNQKLRSSGRLAFAVP